MNGRKFTASNGGTIFLPAAGFGGWEDDVFQDVGNSGTYWSSNLSLPSDSSTPYISPVAFPLLFGRDYVGGYEESRAFGLSVRPVVE